MWGWADTKRMRKQDLKSLDIFSLGLIWAGLLTGRNVITHLDEVDPPMFRLLEILQNVDRPTESELGELGFTLDVTAFIQHVLSGDFEAVRQEIISPKWPENQERREQLLLQKEASGIRAWVLERAKGLSTDSGTLDLIEQIVRFSCRNRPVVSELLSDPYFEDLCAQVPQKVWECQETPHFDDVGEALEAEHQKQISAAEQLRKLHGRSGGTRGSGARKALQADGAFINRILANSVRKVSEQVRSELVQTQRR